MPKVSKPKHPCKHCEREMANLDDIKKGYHIGRYECVLKEKKIKKEFGFYSRLA